MSIILLTQVVPSVEGCATEIPLVAECNEAPEEVEEEAKCGYRERGPRPKGPASGVPRDRPLHAPPADHPHKRDGPTDRPHGPPMDRPHGPPMDRPHGPPMDRPHGRPMDRPHGPPMDRPHGRPMDRPHGPPMDRPHGPPMDRPHGPPMDRPHMLIGGRKPADSWDGIFAFGAFSRGFSSHDPSRGKHIIYYCNYKCLIIFFSRLW